jgi:hypothetical protein
LTRRRSKSKGIARRLSIGCNFGETCLQAIGLSAEIDDGSRSIERLRFTDWRV